MIQDRSRCTTTAITALLLALGSTNATGQDVPPGHMPFPASEDQDGLVAVVLETLDSGGYTYTRVEMEGEEVWVAGPQTVLEVGDTILVSDPMPMEDFTSSSLDRTFDLLYFVMDYRKHEAGAAPAGAVAIDGPTGQVREVLHSAGYTYVQVETEDELVWIAGPITRVTEAQTVSWRDAMEMGAFTSQTLNRTFEKILFVSQIVVVR
jgi:hypothetical protein